LAHDLTRRLLIASSLAAPFIARGARAATAPWTRQAYMEAMAKSGRPVDLTDAQFNAIQARKPAAMKRIESYLKERLGSADPAVMAAFQAVPREYFHYMYDVHRATPGDAYEDNPKPWALGYGSALSDYLGQAYMTQIAKPKPTDVTLEIGTGSGFQSSPRLATTMSKPVSGMDISAGPRSRTGSTRSSSPVPRNTRRRTCSSSSRPAAN
jgi:hypothetical protein